VTKAEILAHRADFQDNGVIDNPIPAIINWPGMLLLHPYTFDTARISTHVAPFYDANSNYDYDPLSGDFPHPKIFPGPQGVLKIPDEMLFFAFHDYTSFEHPVTKGKRMGMQVFCTVWAYSCPEDPFFNNSIFVNLEYWNRLVDPIDSLHLGFLMNVDLDNSNDNFIGSIPEKHIFYTYNGNTPDQVNSEENTPVVSVFAINAYEGATNSTYTSNEYFMPLRDPNAAGPAGSRYPDLPHAFYNYLTGHWADNTPLREGGNGYHPNDELPAVRCAYPGDPTDTIGWSEPVTGNMPGRRMALVSVPASRMNPYTRISRGFCFSWMRNEEAPNTLKSALEFIQDKPVYLSDLWLGWDSPAQYPDCIDESTATFLPQKLDLRIWPNPGTGTFHISCPDENFAALTLTDLSGKTVYQQQNLAISELTLDLPLPPGLYLLTVLTSSNKRLTQKLVVGR
jgi:hypothetical protein